MYRKLDLVKHNNKEDNKYLIIYNNNSKEIKSHK
jgi:hypothetical protein